MACVTPRKRSEGPTLGLPMTQISALRRFSAPEMNDLENRSKQLHELHENMKKTVNQED